MEARQYCQHSFFPQPLNGFDGTESTFNGNGTKNK